MSKNITILMQLKSWSDQIARSNKPLGWGMADCAAKPLAQHSEEKPEETSEQGSALKQHLTLYSKRQELGRPPVFVITTHDLKPYPSSKVD